MSLSKTLYSPKVPVIPRKRLLCSDMTEKLLTGTLNLNINKLPEEQSDQGLHCLLFHLHLLGSLLLVRNLGLLQLGSGQL